MKRGSALRRTPPSTPIRTRSQSAAESQRPLSTDDRAAQSVEVLSAVPFEGPILNNPESSPLLDTNPIYYEGGVPSWVTARKINPYSDTARISPAFARPSEFSLEQQGSTMSANKLDNIENLLKGLVESQHKLNERVDNIELSRQASRAGSRIRSADLRQLTEEAEAIASRQNSHHSDTHHQSHQSQQSEPDYPRELPKPPAGMDESHLRFIKSQEE